MRRSLGRDGIAGMRHSFFYRVIRRLKSLTINASNRLGSSVPSSDSSMETSVLDSSSISGGIKSYLDVCRRAVLDLNLFADFRRHPSYTPVLEHVTEAQGREYLALISREGRAFASLSEAAKNDEIGNPVTMKLDVGFDVSPTTLRYLKVADDLETLFGSLDGFDVVEIGVGYGGQCRLLDSLFELNSYTLVDLRPVLNLADEFLAQFPLRTAIKLLTMNELKASEYSLLLSNYAFTEIRRDVQETYYRKVFEHTARGYITFNDISPTGFNSISRTELCDRLGAVTFPEKPLTHPKNSIIVWGNEGRVLGH